MYREKYVCREICREEYEICIERNMYIEKYIERNMKYIERNIFSLHIPLSKYVYREIYFTFPLSMLIPLSMLREEYVERKRYVWRVMCVEGYMSREKCVQRKICVERVV